MYVYALVSDALYGHKAEVCLVDYFLVRRVTDEQSGLVSRLEPH